MRPAPSLFVFHTRFRWASALTLVVAALALGALVWQSARTGSRVRAVQALLVQIEQVQGDLVDLETGVRGYVITGNARFLEPYRAARGRILDDVAQLERRGPPLVPTLQPGHALRELTTRWLVLGTGEVLARQQSLSAAATLVASGRSKAVMDRLRARLTRDRTLVDAELSRRAGNAQAVTAGGLTAAALLLAATLALLLAGRRLNRGLRAVLVDAAQAAGAFGAGDHAARMPASSSREGQALAGAFNAMAGRLTAALDQLQASNRRLELSNRELEQFAFVASHDLKTPLRTLTSFSELLERRLGEGADARTRRDLAYIAQASRRMNAQVDDLLAYARVQQAELQPTELDLRALVQAAADRLDERLQAAGAELTLGELPAVRGDGALLIRVFEQLLGNALTHRGARAPRLRVTARRAGDWCEVELSDNGPGIPEAYRERAFRLFQRVHAGGGPDGSGVGLALCRQIVERHGGRIWLADGPGGEGLSVHLSLPAA